MEKQELMSSQQTTLLNGRVQLAQSVDGLRASMDSVLLAAAVQARKNDRILDMGCGTGAVGLCVNARLSDLELHLSGVDVQDQMIAIAKQNAIANGLDGRSDYVVGDIQDKALFKPESFDHIVMNPPYYKDGERTSSPDEARERAYTGDLEYWMAAALHWVKQGGSVSIVHRADRLDQILSLAYRKFGAIEIFPVHSKEDEPAIRVVVRMIRNRKTPLKLYPPIILFDAQGAETGQSKSILRDGAGLL